MSILSFFIHIFICGTRKNLPGMRNENDEIQKNKKWKNIYIYLWSISKLFYYNYFKGFFYPYPFIELTIHHMYLFEKNCSGSLFNFFLYYSFQNTPYFFLFFHSPVQQNLFLFSSQIYIFFKCESQLQNFRKNIKVQNLLFQFSAN